MAAWILLLSTLVIFSITLCDGFIDYTPSTYEPSWVYKCLPNEGCQRVDHPHHSITANVTSGELFDSLNHCRTVCGQFGALWPKPVFARIGRKTVSIHPNHLRYDTTKVPADVIELLSEMIKVMKGNILAECGGKVTKVSPIPVVVYLSVESHSKDLTWETDEKYALQVKMMGEAVYAYITGQTVFGLRHGLETFTQLISTDRPDYSDSKECGLNLVTEAEINDHPAYKHRGFLLDTSRNFIPMKDIKRTIHGLAANKMNVFHWHVTDSHSFPLESSRIPQFTRYGAYSPSEIYSSLEVRELVQYALVRGVRVVIEIDAPAHAGNGWQWGKDYGYGDLAVCVNSKEWRKYCIQPPCGQLNPANDDMYRVLRNLYKDIAEVLPKPQLFHMGGDEVFFACWESNEQIKDYMEQKGFSRDLQGYKRLWAEFHAKALQIWDQELSNIGTDGNQSVIIWSSELTNPNDVQKYLNKNRFVIEVWDEMSSSVLHQLIHLGYRVISVPKDIWYLDHGFWGRTTYSNWRRMYSYRLPRGTAVLGGEVAMWSEYMDSNVLDGRVWPRAAAVAERLWSSPANDATALDAARLAAARDRLVRLGLNPDVLGPEWCTQHDSKCQ